MPPQRNRSLILLVLLVVLVFIYNFGSGLYVAEGIEPLPTFEFLYRGALLCGVVWWLDAESGRSAVKRIYCSGLLVSIGLFIIVPYHLFKTRGLKGFIPLLALLASFIVAYILGVVVHLLFWKQAAIQ